MQLTPKFILLAIAFTYGGIVVSAAPVRESSLVARGAAYEDVNAREIDDMKLFVRGWKEILSKLVPMKNSSGYTRVPSPLPRRSSSLDKRPVSKISKRNEEIEYLKNNPKVYYAALADKKHRLHKAALELQRRYTTVTEMPTFKN
jgi:hypothetical protein